MTIRRKLGTAALAATTAFGLLGSGVAGASPIGSQPRTQLTALQTADRFLAIAYTWKGSWCQKGEPSVGKRDVRYASTTLDSILKKVSFTPEMDICSVAVKPGIGKQLSRRSLPAQAIALKIKLPLVETGAGQKPYHGHFSTHLHLKKIGGDWKVVGVHLPGDFGPAKYCDDSSAATAECNIFPAGSN